MSPIYSSSQLLTICDAEQTQTNICIAETIINMYMQSKNFFTENMVECFNNFLSTGNLDFAKYNIKF